MDTFPSMFFPFTYELYLQYVGIIYFIKFDVASFIPLTKKITRANSNIYIHIYTRYFFLQYPGIGKETEKIGPVFIMTIIKIL